MQVTVKFFANFREVTGVGQEQVKDISTVRELLEKVVKKYGTNLSKLLYDESGKLRDTVHVMVNGRAIDFLDELETKLNDGDAVAIFPPISGG